MLQKNKLSVAQLSKDDRRTLFTTLLLLKTNGKKELLKVKDSQLEVNGFELVEIKSIREHICVR